MLENIVFYADDDIDDIELLSEAFDAYTKKIKLVTALDGLAALTRLKEFQEKRIQPCLVILDINMPYLSGKEVLKTLRGMDFFSQTPIILFSTSNSIHDKRLAEEYNSILITKPVNVIHLHNIADTFIDYCHDEVKKKLRQVL